MKYKLYSDLYIDYVVRLSVSTNKKCLIYHLIFVFINKLIKMCCYEPMKITIILFCLIKAIIDVISMRHNSQPDSIMSNCGLVFIFKFWSSLYSFLKINLILLITFCFPTNIKIKKQNSLIKAYLQALINYK